jgi:hypothetical protein
VNYLRSFILNLSKMGKAFTTILWLKDGAEFNWGDEQQVTFEEIKGYLPTLQVLNASRSGIPF